MPNKQLANSVGRVFSLILLIALLFATINGQAQNHKAAKIDGLFAEYDHPDTPGASVIVIKDGRVLFMKAFGLASLEERRPVTTSTNFRLASITKQFTAMAIMMLAEQKKLSYDNRLTDFFPDFPEYGKRVTVRHLLNHVSGLIEYGEVIPKGTTTPLTDNDVLSLMKQQNHTYFPPGLQFRYSNTGYTLLGLIVEKVSGLSFSGYLKKKIFEPLGMNHTVFYRREDQSDHRRAYGYTLQGRSFARTDWSLTTAIRGDGSIYSSVRDLYKWDQALYRERLVRTETLREAFTAGVSVDKTTGYGFGWFIEDKRGLRTVWHGGNTIGFTSAIQRFPEKRFTVIVLTNRNQAQLADIVDKIEDLYLFDTN